MRKVLNQSKSQAIFTCTWTRLIQRSVAFSVLTASLAQLLVPTLSMAAETPSEAALMRYLHQTFANRIGGQSETVKRFTYYSRDQKADMDKIVQHGTPQPLTGKGAHPMFDTPFLRMDQLFSNSQVMGADLGQFTGKLDYINATPLLNSEVPAQMFADGSPVLKMLRESAGLKNTVIVIVPGLASDILPLTPFYEAISDYTENQGSKGNAEIMIARIPHATAPAQIAAEDLSEFLKSQSPLFDKATDYMSREIIFLAYDHGVNTVLELLGNPKNAAIVNRTRSVVNLAGLAGGLSQEKVLNGAEKGSEGLAVALALAGKIAAAGNLKNGFAGVEETILKAESKMQSEEGKIEDAFMTRVAPLLSSLKDKDIAQNLENAINNNWKRQKSILVQNAKSMDQISKSATHSKLETSVGKMFDVLSKVDLDLYIEKTLELGKTLGTLRPTEIRAKNVLNLAQIKRKDGKPVTFFSIGAIANPTDFRIVPPLDIQGGSIKLAHRQKEVGADFSWDELVLYAASLPGFAQDARFDGVVKYEDSLWLDREIKQLNASNKNTAIKAIDLGAFRAHHFGIATGGLFTANNPFPRKLLFEAILETLSQYPSN